MSCCHSCKCNPCRCGGMMVSPPMRCPQVAPPVYPTCPSPSNPPAVSCPEYYYKVKETFTVSSTGSFNAYCADKWAKPGSFLYLNGIGWVKVTSVNGETITYKNINIDLGSGVVHGTPILPLPPIDFSLLSSILCGDECPCDDSVQLPTDRLLVCRNGILTHVTPAP